MAANDFSNGFFETYSRFGTLTGWEPSPGGNSNITEQRAQALGADGDEIRWKGYDQKEQVTANYVSTLDTGDLTLPNVGGMLNGYLLENLKVTYQNTGFAALALTGHKHLGTGANPDQNTRQYAPSVVLPATDLGAPLQIKDADDNTIFSLTEGAAFSVRSLSYTLACQHVDEPKANGQHLAGDNYDGVETLEIEFTGSGILGTDFTVSSDWHVDTKDKSESNTGITTSSITLTHHVAHVPASSQSQS